MTEAVYFAIELAPHGREGVPAPNPTPGVAALKFHVDIGHGFARRSAEVSRERFVAEGKWNESGSPVNPNDRGRPTPAIGHWFAPYHVRSRRPGKCSVAPTPKSV